MNGKTILKGGHGRALSAQPGQLITGQDGKGLPQRPCKVVG